MVWSITNYCFPSAYAGSQALTTTCIRDRMILCLGDAWLDRYHALVPVASCLHTSLSSRTRLEGQAHPLLSSFGENPQDLQARARCHVEHEDGSEFNGYRCWQRGWLHKPALEPRRSLAREAGTSLHAKEFKERSCVRSAACQPYAAESCKFKTFKGG